MFPASAPKSVPRLQPGSAAHMAPIKYQTLSKPSCAIAMPKTSSVTSKPMSIRTAERRIRGKLLAERAAHKHVSGVDDERHKDHHPHARVFRDDCNAAVFSGGGVIEKAHKEALKGCDSGGVAGNADAEADGEIAERVGRPSRRPSRNFFRFMFYPSFSSCTLIIAYLLTLEKRMFMIKS